MNLSFLLDNESVNIDVKGAICIGYAGRNQELVKAHIEELAKEGIAPPPEVPMVYPVSDLLVTQEEEVQVLGTKTSGEVEFVLIHHKDEWYVTLGSDHTDRELEAYSIPYAKQATPKPIAKQLWRMADCTAHWDELVLTCEIQEQGGQWEIYQSGTVASILSLEEIFRFLEKKEALHPNGSTVVFSGTVPVKDGHFRFAPNYRLTLHDPVLKREITLNYQVEDISK